MTIGTGVVGGRMNWTGAYAQTFGQLPDGMRYQDNLKSIDLRPKAQMKALNTATGGSGTASSTVLVPIYISQSIVDISRKYTPLREMIPRVTNFGLAAVYDRITAKGGAFTANPDAPMPESDDTYAQVAKNIKYLYAVGRVLGPMEVATPGYVLEGFQSAGAGNSAGNPFSNVSAPNAMQLEVQLKTRSLFELEENLIINGDSSTDSTQFDGFVKLQSTTNQIDLATADFTWDDVERCAQTAWAAGGRPSLGVASATVVRRLRSIMIDVFRLRPDDFKADGYVSFGLPVGIVLSLMTGPLVVIPSMYLSDTAGERSLYMLDTDWIEMRVLQDVVFEQLAKTNDSRKFMLKIYEVLILRAPEFNAFLDNIA